MNDTSPEIQSILDSMMSSKTPKQRLKMVFSMFESSKKMIKASLENEKGSHLSEAELKTGIFLRLYSDLFSQDEIAKIFKYLKK